VTTMTLSDFHLSPQIVVGISEHRQLLVLAMAGRGHTADDADGLLYELERAKVVTDHSVPSDAVRMGSTVRYRSNGGVDRVVQLVFPKDADIAHGRISVLTPVGTALLGLRVGQSITWLTRDGRNQMLTVLGVTPPDGGSDSDGPLAA
jgi:regulator of nucleoside diphosphate kinase